MRLISIELGSQVPDIDAPAVGEQPVLVRFHGKPLGLLTLSHGCTSADLTALAIARFATAIAAHLIADRVHHGGGLELDPFDPAAMESECPGPIADDGLPSLTVAVCTRDRPGDIRGCLDKLSALDYPGPRLDRLLVDNVPSTDLTERIVRSDYPHIRYVREPRPGLNWARNRAVLEARGDIVAFTDDDASVDPAWARALAEVFVEEPDAMAVTGLVVPDELDTPSQKIFETYGGFGRGFRRRYFSIDRGRGEKVAPLYAGTGLFGTGANMAFRRQLFDEIGLFDPALDVGTVTNGGGDLEMFFRVVKEGHLLVYEPAAVVAHRHRRHYTELRRQIANNGVGFYAYLTRSAKAYAEERADLVRFGAWWLWSWNIRRLLRSFVTRPLVPRDLIVAELVGSLAGLWRYAAAQREAQRIRQHFGPQQPARAAHGAA